VGLAGALLTSTSSPDAIIITGDGKEFVSDSTTTSKLTTFDKAEFSSGATRPSAITSSLTIIADGAALEEKESIVGNLLEKAIDDIDKQMEEEALLKQQKQNTAEENARLKAEAESKARVEAEARAKAEELKLKEQAEAKVSYHMWCLLNKPQQKQICCMQGHKNSLFTITIESAKLSCVLYSYRLPLKQRQQRKQRRR
jgi:hypothetical protein